jgi:hypothetical protein
MSYSFNISNRNNAIDILDEDKNNSSDDLFNDDCFIKCVEKYDNESNYKSNSSSNLELTSDRIQEVYNKSLENEIQDTETIFKTQKQVNPKNQESLFEEILENDNNEKSISIFANEKEYEDSDEYKKLGGLIETANKRLVNRTSQLWSTTEDLLLLFALNNNISCSKLNLRGTSSCKSRVKIIIKSRLPLNYKNYFKEIASLKNRKIPLFNRIKTNEAIEENLELEINRNTIIKPDSEEPWKKYEFVMTNQLGNLTHKISQEPKKKDNFEMTNRLENLTPNKSEEPWKKYEFEMRNRLENLTSINSEEPWKNYQSVIKSPGKRKLNDPGYGSNKKPKN